LYPIGEIQNQPFQLSFNASPKVDCQGSRVTSHGGLILVRELDERLGLGVLIEQPAVAGRVRGSSRRKQQTLWKTRAYARAVGRVKCAAQNPLFRCNPRIFALKIEFVLSSFFATFVDSKGLVEFVPSI
jgi:hypothetical protein